MLLLLLLLLLLLCSCSCSCSCLAFLVSVPCASRRCSIPFNFGCGATEPVEPAAVPMNGVLPDAPRAPTTMETPSWFFSDSSCNTVESQRAEQRLAEQLRELQQMCARPPLPCPPCPRRPAAVRAARPSPLEPPSSLAPRGFYRQSVPDASCPHPPACPPALQVPRPARAVDPRGAGRRRRPQRGGQSAALRRRRRRAGARTRHDVAGPIPAGLSWWCHPLGQRGGERDLGRNLDIHGGSRS